MQHGQTSVANEGGEIMSLYICNICAIEGVCTCTYIDRCRYSHLMYFIVHGHAGEVASVCQYRCGLCVWREGVRGECIVLEMKTGSVLKVIPRTEFVVFW